MLLRKTNIHQYPWSRTCRVTGGHFNPGSFYTVQRTLNSGSKGLNTKSLYMSVLKVIFSSFIMCILPNVTFAKFRGMRSCGFIDQKCIKDFVFITNPASENPLGK